MAQRQLSATPTGEDPTRRLADIWIDFLPGIHATPETDFFAAGGHSLLASRMLSRTENAFGVRIGLREFLQQPTLGTLVRLVSKTAPAQQFRFDRYIRLGNGAARPIFVVVHSNGAFFPLGHTLGKQHVFIALQAADRRNGGEIPENITDIAAAYVRQLLGVQPHGPYVLLGWCLGGVLAYEAAQQLRKAGHDVAGIVMVDSWNPAYFSRMGWLRRQLAERSYGGQVVLTGFLKVLRGQKTLRTFLRQRNLVRKFLGTGSIKPAGTDAEIYFSDQAFDENLLRRVKQASQNYRPLPFDRPVLHIRSSEEPCRFALDRRFGWGDVVGKALRQETVPGDHVSVFMAPSVQQFTHLVQRQFISPHAGD